MAISTFDELKAAAANWLVRADLTARVPEFITLAEARLNRVVRSRRAVADETLTGVVGSRFIPLPSTFAEPLAFWIVRSTGRDELRPVDPTLMAASTTAAEPSTWGIDGGNIAFERPCDQAYTFVLRMLSKYALSTASPTNALLTASPDVYLYATLCEAAPFLRDAELSNAYERRLSRAIAELNSKDARSNSLQTLGTDAALLSPRRGGYNIATDC